MTQFRKELNRLLKKEAYSGYIDLCNRGLMTFNETMTCISERICLEEDVFNAVKGDKFSMIYMTEDELKKKVETASTDTLKEYMDWYLNGKRVGS